MKLPPNSSGRFYSVLNQNELLFSQLSPRKHRVRIYNHGHFRTFLQVHCIAQRGFLVFGEVRGRDLLIRLNYFGLLHSHLYLVLVIFGFDYNGRNTLPRLHCVGMAQEYFGYYLFDSITHLNESALLV